MKSSRFFEGRRARGFRLSAFPILFMGAITLLPSPARAFVCTRVLDSAGQETGPSISWADRDIEFRLQVDGTSDVAGTGELDALRDSFLVWQNATGCVGGTTDLALAEGPLSSSRSIGYDFARPDDNENLLLFQDAQWPHAPATGGSGVLALTTTTFDALTGTILDADIEFNTDEFDFTVSDLVVNNDLMNTAVHEIGHFLGLGHPPQPDASMFASAPVGETQKRDLACDDSEAVVFKYPAGVDNGYCATPADSCGFCAAPGALRSRPTIRVVGSADGSAVCE